MLCTMSALKKTTVKMFEYIQVSQNEQYSYIEVMNLTSEELLDGFVANSLKLND